MKNYCDTPVPRASPNKFNAVFSIKSVNGILNNGLNFTFNTQKSFFWVESKKTAIHEIKESCLVNYCIIFISHYLCTNTLIFFIGMEITGKLIRKNAPLTGQSAKGQRKKQEVIIKTEGAYPKTVCLMIWNDKVDIDRIEIGQTIKAYVEAESREFNNKWYTDIKIWKLETVAAGAQTTKKAANDIPLPEPPPEIETDNYVADEGDLPF